MEREKEMHAENRYDSLFRYYGAEYDIPWSLLKAQAMAESAMNPEAVSPAGAKGLTQFMLPTWKEWGEHGDPFNPEHAIKAQARYMRWLLDSFKEEEAQVEKALAAYNWGIGNLKGAMTRWDGWRLASLPRETYLYIIKIKRLWAAYEDEA